MRKFYLAVIIIVVFGIFMSATRTKEEGPAKKVRVAFFESTPEYESLINTAEVEGFFKENNIEIETVEGAKDISALLASGEADVSIQYLSSTAGAYLSGRELAWIGSLANYPSDQCRYSSYKDDEIEKVKKVAVNRLGGADHITAASVLAKEGLDFSDLTFFQTNGEPGKAALIQKKEIDYAVMLCIFTKGLEGNISDPVETFKNVKAPRAIIASKKFIDERREAAKGFLEAIRNAVDFEANNETKVVKFLIDKYSFSEAEAKGTYQNFIKAREGVEKTPTKKVLEDLKPIIDKVTGKQLDLSRIDPFIVTNL